MPNDRAPLPPASPLPSGAVAGASVGKQTLVASAPSGAPRADGDVDRDAYYRHHAPEIVRDAAAHLSGLPFGLHDPALRWRPAGDRRFAAAMAAQLPPVAPATAEIESLVRPELLGRLIDDARVRTREPNTGIAGLAAPQAAVLAASGQPVTAAALDVPGLAARAAHARTQLGIARAQLPADPATLDGAALQAASVETRDLAFESQVAAHAAALDDAWRALDDADTWMSSAIDHLETAAMQREGAGYRARWLAIHAQIRKGRAGDKAAMSAARTAFEKLCGEPAFVAYLGRAQRLLVRLQKAHVIASLIVVVAITIASMGAGAGVAGLFGGAAADGAAALGVARGLASAVGLLAEAMTFSALSNAAFSRDHSVGAIAIVVCRRATTEPHRVRVLALR